MHIPLVLVTKDKSESDELFEKQAVNAEGTLVEGTLFSPYIMREADIQDHFNTGGGGSIIVPDNASKLEMSVRLMSRYKAHREGQGRDGTFALVVDECDAMYRTVNRSQKMEQALEDLRNLGPSLHMLVSATPTPVLLLYKEEYNQELKMFTIGTSDDYVGVDKMKPLRDANDNVVYLDEKLSHSSDGNIDFGIDPTFDEHRAEKLYIEDEEESRFRSNAKEGTTIPCTDKKVKKLVALRYGSWIAGEECERHSCP